MSFDGLLEEDVTDVERYVFGVYIRYLPATGEFHFIKSRDQELFEKSSKNQGKSQEVIDNDRLYPKYTADVYFWSVPILTRYDGTKFITRFQINHLVNQVFLCEQIHEIYHLVVDRAKLEYGWKPAPLFEDIELE